MEFDMSTIKEMVESLEDDTYQFKRNKDDPSSNNKLNTTPKEDQQSYERIMSYMKKEISKIDNVNETEKNPQIVRKLMKDFINNLKRIDLSPRVMDDEDDSIKKSPNVFTVSGFSPATRKTKPFIHVITSDNNENKEKKGEIIKLQNNYMVPLESEGEELSHPIISIGLSNI
jgi:hypothetical protein